MGSTFADDRLEVAMTGKVQEKLARQLCDSVDNLQKQVEKVEFWASAVTGFTQPVPDYEPEATAVASYVKPGRRPRKRLRRRVAHHDATAAPPDGESKTHPDGEDKAENNRPDAAPED